MSGSQKFEEQIIDNLRYLVKQLTTSGNDDLNPSLMKKLKHICKQSDTYVAKVYYIIMQQFEKKHAEIRLSCFAIFDQLFNRSHHFRCLVLNDFSKVIDLVLGPTGKKHDLKPVSVATKFKKKAIIAIKMWHDKYGDAYKLLAIGVDYMINCKYVDFVSMTAMTPGERAQEEETKRLSKELELNKVAEVKSKLAEIIPQIKSDLTAYKNCFQLLIPNIEDFFIPLSDEAENDDTESIPNSKECDTYKENVQNLLHSPNLNFSQESDDNDSLQEGTSDAELYGSDYVRSTGILKGTSVKIDLAAIHTIQETVDNQTVIENLKELIIALKTKWIPTIKRLQSLIMPYCKQNADTFEQITKINTALESAVSCYTSVTIIPNKKLKSEKASGTKKIVDRAGNSSDSDDDFIEVTDCDPRVARAMHSEAELLGLLETPVSSKLSKWSLDSNAGSSSSGLAAQKTGSNDVSKQNCCNSIQLTQLLPSSMEKRPSDQTPEMFLGEWTPPVLYANPLAGLSQVWLSSSNSQLEDDDKDAPRTGGLLGMVTTPVNVPTAFEPVQWQCRAPLPSGRLCPRRDRVKCPLHGKVLPRNSATGIADLDYATQVLRRARTRAGLPPEEEEGEPQEMKCDAVGSASTTERLHNCEEVNNKDDTTETDDISSCQRMDGVQFGFCLDNSSENETEVVNEEVVAVLKKRSERKKLCSRLNDESGAAVNNGQRVPLLSSKRDRRNAKDGVDSSKKLCAPNQSDPLIASADLPPSNIKAISANDETISVAAAERLVEAVKVARLADRRRRMNLDQDWQNPALLAELKAATGVDLDMRNVKKRQRDGEGGLTDLRKLEATPRKRLAKKVLSKGAMCRLNRALAKH